MPQPDRSALQWRAKLNLARNEREVLSVVRDFLSSIPQAEWASLSLEPIAANLDSANALAHLSYEVVRKSHADLRSAETLIVVMTSVLSDAVARIAHLGNPRNAKSA